MAEYPLKAICDTSVYIPFINQGIAHPVFSDKSVSPVLYMSSVVLSELYSGAHDSQSIKLLNKLHHTFQNVGRLIVPNDGDWRQTGGIIAKLKKSMVLKQNISQGYRMIFLLLALLEKSAHSLLHRTKRTFGE